MRQLFVSIAAAAVLAGCSDPLSNVTRIDDVDVSGQLTTVAEVPNAGSDPDEVFGGLLDRDPEDQNNAIIEAAVRDAGGVSDDISTPDPSTAEDTGPERRRRGLIGMFSRNGDRAPEPRTGPDATDVTLGTVMPFGEIARVCDVSNASLGSAVEGGSGFQIFDSQPSSSVARPFYITGFEDDCARTFTGALVIPGDVETHEFVRYQSSNERIDYSSTDNAYEALKASVCRVGRGQPCGERTDRLNENTYFITVYGFFGATFSAVPTEWAQILLHDGEVVAMSIKSGE